VAHHANTTWLEVAEQIAALSAPSGTDEPGADTDLVAGLIRDFHDQAIAQLELVGELAAGGDPALALARYLGASSTSRRA